MKFFLVLNGTKLKQFFVILIAAIFAIGIAYAEKQNISVFTSKAGPAAIYKVDTNQKKLALTFDISWGEKQVTPILDILKEKNVKQVTFFLSGEWVQEHPELVKQIHEAGYEIGSHGYKHINYSRLTDEEITSQMRQADRILQEVVGEKPTLIRPPNGDIDKRVLRIADQMNYTVVLWDTDSRDWLRPGVDQIIENVVSAAHRGDIILLHASDSATETHLALPTIIDQLRKDGYEFVTISQLMTDAKTKTESLD